MKINPYAPKPSFAETFALMMTEKSEFTLDIAGHMVHMLQKDFRSKHKAGMRVIDRMGKCVLERIPNSTSAVEPKVKMSKIVPLGLDSVSVEEEPTSVEEVMLAKPIVAGEDDLVSDVDEPETADYENSDEESEENNDGE